MNTAICSIRPFHLIEEMVTAVLMEVLHTTVHRTEVPRRTETVTTVEIVTEADTPARITEAVSHSGVLHFSVQETITHSGQGTQ